MTVFKWSMGILWALSPLLLPAVISFAMPTRGDYTPIMLTAGSAFAMSFISPVALGIWTFVSPTRRTIACWAFSLAASTLVLGAFYFDPGGHVRSYIAD